MVTGPRGPHGVLPAAAFPEPGGHVQLPEHGHVPGVHGCRLCLSCLVSNRCVNKQMRLQALAPSLACDVLVLVPFLWAGADAFMYSCSATEKTLPRSV